MTLSKEKLAHYAMHTDGSVKAMARELIERRGRDKQEPDGWQFLGVNGLWVNVTENGMRQALKEGSEVRALYAAPQLPQPAVPEYLENLRSLVADKRALPRRKEWVSGQQYSYVLLENVEGLVEEACRATMLQGAEPVQGWIPCSERMPTENDIVLVVDDGYFVCEAQYREGDFFSAVRGKGEFFETTCRDVELWMPLPAAPQQEADNE
ncbi:MAG: DUF551 domain-containing protein [Leclercia adecarboxylata]|nr:DUF551 domain-containing protein [Leclercia adecarboxylata]